MFAPPRAPARVGSGIYAMENALRRRGFAHVAGADEAGRGACAGPLVTAAVLLAPGKRGEIPGLADSKLLTPLARDRVFDEVRARALAYEVVVVPASEVDARGLHHCNVEALRRAVSRLSVPADYVLVDGFPVTGMGAPTLAVWKGDQVCGAVAAASVLAKVTRDRLMAGLHERYPMYEFATHKGYVTATHSAALRTYGPCPEHRFRYANVAAAARAAGRARYTRPVRSQVGVSPRGELAVGHNGPVEGMTK